MFQSRERVRDPEPEVKRRAGRKEVYHKQTIETAWTTSGQL